MKNDEKTNSNQPIGQQYMDEWEHDILIAKGILQIGGSQSEEEQDGGEADEERP